MSGKNYCVYCHTSPSGKRYIGITCQSPTRRWHSGKGYVQHPYFYNAILKYGWSKIRHEILCEGLSREEACQKEVELIAEYQSNDPRYGYNLSSGGESGFAGCSWTVERKEAKRNAMIGNKYALGFKQTKETRKHMSDAQLRREHSPLTERQKAICIANLPPPRYGGDNPASRPVLCVELNIVFSCGKEAAEALGLQRSHISNVCKGKRKTTGGYHFKYFTEEKEVFSS